MLLIEVTPVTLPIMALTNTCSDDTCCDTCYDTCCDTCCVGLLEHLIVACGDLMSFQDLSQRCAYMEAKRTADRVQIAQAPQATHCDDEQLAAAAECSDDERHDAISICVRWQPEKGSVLYSLLKCLRDVIAGAHCCCCCCADCCYCGLTVLVVV